MGQHSVKSIKADALWSSKTQGICFLFTNRLSVILWVLYKTML